MRDRADAALPAMHTGRTDPIAHDAPRLPEHDRRLPLERGGLVVAWRRLKGLLKRPLRLERRGLQLHLVLLERRRSREPFRPASDQHLLLELRTRLLAIDHEHAAAGMRQLVRVHDVLRRRGWAGVEALSARDLRRALAQADLLASLEPSASMTHLIERLRVHLTAATLREERRARLAAEDSETAVQVIETDFDAFAASQHARLADERAEAVADGRAA